MRESEMATECGKSLELESPRVTSLEMSMYMNKTMLKLK
jgi:hypothetical protein